MSGVVAVVAAVVGMEDWVVAVALVATAPGAVSVAMLMAGVAGSVGTPVAAVAAEVVGVVLVAVVGLAVVVGSWKENEISYIFINTITDTKYSNIQNKF